MFMMMLAMFCAGEVAANASTPAGEAAKTLGQQVAALTFVWDGGDEERMLAAAATGAPLQEPTARPRAFEYSDGYRTRRKIHKYASFATLPLFVAQFAVGQKLWDQQQQNEDASDGLRSTHAALAAGTGALFAVNTVTGVWNLSEGRKDPSHRNKRRLHSILMLAADAGFVATGLITPEDEERGPGGLNDGGRSTHRAVALTSMGIATVAYLVMLLGH
jgi:hypothetical protein